VKNLIRLQLTPEQTQQVASLAIDAGLNRENVLFVCTVVPFWLPESGEMSWEFQIVKIRSKSGLKVIKVIRENSAD
jgi:hypothetical protein